jgi:GR25 family glycosyltransferase involved in LPS biosynthesis
MEDIFTKIYDKQVWKSSENCPLSGNGSGLKYNEKYTNLFTYKKKVVGIIKPNMNLKEFNCYYINLSRRLDRRLQITQQLESYGIHGKRIEAIDGQEMTQQENDYWLDRLHIRYNTRIKKKLGIIGCWRSHMLTLEKAISDGVDKLWVIEDDATIITTDIPPLPKDLVLGYLGGVWWNKASKKSPQINIGGGWVYIDSEKFSIVSTISYIINGRDNIKKIYNILNNSKRIKPIDICLKNLIQPTMKCYYLTPVVVVADLKFPSDVTNIYEGKPKLSKVQFLV